MILEDSCLKEFLLGYGTVLNGGIINQWYEPLKQAFASYPQQEIKESNPGLLVRQLVLASCPA